jgi:hypothetical protein
MLEAGTTSLLLLRANSNSPVRSDSMRTPTRARAAAGDFRISSRSASSERDCGAAWRPPTAIAAASPTASAIVFT